MLVLIFQFFHNFFDVRNVELFLFKLYRLLRDGRYFKVHSFFPAYGNFVVHSV